MKWSRDAASVLDIYLDEFASRWGIDREAAAVIGARSKAVVSAEFKEHGSNAYATSVLLPIRNAFYASSQLDERWTALRMMNLAEPILDYGCGVGALLVWLKRNGFSRLYGYELSGIQHDIMTSVCVKEGIAAWEGEPVETVLCMNVLEHVDRPVELLETLMKLSGRVIANICTDHDASHVAPEEDLEECRKMLENSGGLYRAA